MVSYAMTGICVSVMPAFMAECAPASLRGMVTSQLQMQIVVAQLVASAVNFGTSKSTGDAGWRISLGEPPYKISVVPLLTTAWDIGIQFVMPGLLLLLYPFIIESPRWSVEYRSSRVEIKVRWN